MSDFLAIVAVGLGTYASRAFFIVALANRTIPARVLQTLQYVGPAVLASLVVALLIDSEGRVGIGVPELAALAVGGGVAYRTRSHILTLIVGMGVFWVVRTIF